LQKKIRAVSQQCHARCHTCLSVLSFGKSRCLTSRCHKTAGRSVTAGRGVTEAVAVSQDGLGRSVSPPLPPAISGRAPPAPDPAVERCLCESLVGGDDFATVTGGGGGGRGRFADLLFVCWGGGSWLRLLLPAHNIAPPPKPVKCRPQRRHRPALAGRPRLLPHRLLPGHPNPIALTRALVCICDRGMPQIDIHDQRASSRDERHSLKQPEERRSMRPRTPREHARPLDILLALASCPPSSAQK